MQDVDYKCWVPPHNSESSGEIVSTRFGFDCAAEDFAESFHRSNKYFSRGIVKVKNMETGEIKDVEVVGKAIMAFTAKVPE